MGRRVRTTRVPRCLYTSHPLPGVGSTKHAGHLPLLQLKAELLKTENEEPKRLVRNTKYGTKWF